MKRSMHYAGQLGAFLALLVYTSLYGQSDTLFATGAFKTNTAATITVSALNASTNKIPDKTYKFLTGTGNSVNFKLPVGIQTSGITSQYILPRMNPKFQQTGQGFTVTLAPSFAGKQVSVYRVSGQKVYSFIIDRNGIADCIMSGFPEGMYAIHLDGAKETLGKYLKVHSSQGGRFTPNPSLQHFTDLDDIQALSATNANYKISVVPTDFVFAPLENFAVSLVAGDNGTVTLTLDSLSDTSAAGMFMQLISAKDWDILFPNRYGIGNNPYGDFDIYSYNAFLQALNEMAANTVKANINYKLFLTEGNLETRKQECAAFFGNICHETGHLYWIEEVKWQQGSTELGYRDEGNKTYPPAPGKSYHGRGPIQLSWNYNYGRVSEFFYNDKNILLNKPEMVIEGDGVSEPGKIAFMTAIWFWMTAGSATCHDAMVGKWIPGPGQSRFGKTIDNINGGLECGHGDGDSRVLARIKYYKEFCSFLKITPDAYADCGNM